MPIDLADQLRDYLEQHDPVTVEEVMTVPLKPDRRPSVRGPWLAAAVALVVLGVGVSFGVVLRQHSVNDLGHLQGDWDLVSFEVGGERVPIPDDVSWVGIRFSERGEWSGDFCNHKTGKYRFRDDSIEITIGFSTAGACKGTLKTLEEAAEEAFTPGPYDYTLSGDRLELRRGATVILVQRRIQPVDH